ASASALATSKLASTTNRMRGASLIGLFCSEHRPVADSCDKSEQPSRGEAHPCAPDARVSRWSHLLGHPGSGAPRSEYAPSELTSQSRTSCTLCGIWRAPGHTTWRGAAAVP